MDPPYRGHGVADSLYRRLEQRLRERGEAGFMFVVGEQLAPAHRFYRRMGAREVAQIQVHRGQGSSIYVHDFAGLPPAAGATGDSR